MNDSPEIPPRDTTISPDVLDAYRTAHYSFKITCQTVDFRIGQPCAALAAIGIPELLLLR